MNLTDLYEFDSLDAANINLARLNAMDGLDLAYKANEAHTGYKAARELLDNYCAAQLLADVTVDLSRVDQAFDRARVRQAMYFDLVDAAGALIGKLSLGGEYVARQTQAPEEAES